MTLKEKINADYLSAFKARYSLAKNLLSVIKGGIQLAEKNLMTENLPDDKVIEILKAAAKSSRETISKLQDEDLKHFAELELKIIESYLPKQMEETEIRVKINELMKGGASNIAEIMRAFKDLPADRQKVAQIFNSLK